MTRKLTDSMFVLRVMMIALLVPLSSLAQEYGYEDIVADLEVGSAQNEPPQMVFGLTSADFENVAYNLKGSLYSANVTWIKKNTWTVGIEVPYLVGENTGIRSQELGNPQFKTRFNILDIGPEFSVWIPASVRLGQRGNNYVLASHHDTYRVGLEFDYVKGRIGSTIGGGYQMRISEEDPQYDIGNIIDYKVALRYLISSRWSVQGAFQWFRVQPTLIQKKEIVKEVDWASVAPGVAFHVVDGLDFTTSVVIPVIQTGTPLETDLAFGEVYYPQSSRVSLAWGLGASF